MVLYFIVIYYSFKFYLYFNYHYPYNTFIYLFYYYILLYYIERVPEKNIGIKQSFYLRKRVTSKVHRLYCLNYAKANDSDSHVTHLRLLS